MATSTKSDTTSAPAREAAPGHRLRKPHEMIVMVPRSQRVTLTGRRMYNVLLHLAQQQLRALNAMPAADEVPFQAPLARVLRTSGASVEDRTVAKRYLREMKGLEVDWESTAPGDGIKYRGFNMLSEVVLEQRNGENWVLWAFPPTIMGALRSPRGWAQLELDILAKLGTYTSLALYEICFRYRDNPSGLTSRKPVQWWTDALSPTPPGTERREWRKFKNERIKAAIQEINEVTDLQIELREHKEGRVIVEAQFFVRKKAVSASTVFDASPVDATLVYQGEKHGISEVRIEELVRSYGEELVKKNLDLLEARIANRDYRPVEHNYAYLKARLREASGESLGVSAVVAARETPVPSAPGTAVGTGQPKTDMPPTPGAEKQGMPETRSPVKASAPEPDPEAVARAQARITHQAEFMRLPEQEREYWISRVFDRLSRTPHFTASARKRVRDGDFFYGVFGVQLIDTWLAEREPEPQGELFKAPDSGA